MRSNKTNSLHRGETRRHFIKKSGMAAAALAGAGLFSFPASARENDPGVSIVLDPEDAVLKQPPVQWAVGELQDALTARGVAVQFHDSVNPASSSQECVAVGRAVWESADTTMLDAPEAFWMARRNIGKRPTLLVGGSDARGLVYALLELADRIHFAADPIAALKAVKPAGERPANVIRSIMRGFNSDVEDKAWFQDRAFWPPYLTMLAANRFNRFSLTLGLGYDSPSGLRDCYFYFAYPFLLSVPGYNVRAVPLPDAERDRNLEMLRFISEETARRGLHFQLGIWTHAYQWTDSPEANYTIEGLTPETQAPYCRDALRALLAACPAISGVTFRIHGESGVPEGSYNFWKTIFDGAAQCGRRVEIDMHAKGMDQGMIDVALGTGLPVNISPKFWAEHMGLPYMQGAIRQLEMPSRNASNTGFFSRSSGSRSFLRYGYGDLLAEDRRYGVLHRIWPGTQRLLLWGDPETAAAYGRVSSFCGSKGVELFEPLFFKGRKGSGLPGGRDAYADAALKPARDFEKYDYAYRVWGRNLYNPDGDADGWRRALARPFGRGSDDVENALASASRILPLVTTAHCPSAANNNYWPEMYYNMPVVDAGRRHPYEDTASPKRFSTVSPLDPEFFLGMDEFAGELIQGEASGKYSPAWVAGQLEADADKATARLRAAESGTRDTRSADFRRLAEDVTLQAGLGRFFAAKFRAGVLYALYLRTGHRPALEEAIKNYRAARATWAAFAQTAKNIYVRDITFGPDYFQRDQWRDRLPAVDADIADMEALLRQPPENPAAGVTIGEKLLAQAMRAVFAGSKGKERPALAGFHEPGPSFQRGRPLTIVARAPKAGDRSLIAGLRLRYRRVNQAETWRMVEMERAGDGHRAVIPSDYTDSPFPLQYHFQVRSGSGRAWQHPGLEHRWHGQPYFFVRQA